MPDGGLSFPLTEPPEPGTAAEIADGVLWCRLPLPMRLDHVNVFALDDGDGWTVVDTGLDWKRCREAWEALLSGPMAGKPVTRVIVTHHHPDHIGLAGMFIDRGAELWTSRTAYLMTRMLVLDEEALPSERSLDFWRGAGMAPGMLEKRAQERPFNFADIVAPIPAGYRRIAAGDTIEAGGRTWDVLTGHGHAPEHLTFWARGEPLVIGGDQLLPSISPNLGVYPNEPLDDPVGAWMDSCRALLPAAEPDQLVLPGHKLPFRGLPARLVQMIDNHVEALDRLRAHLAEPRTAVDCFRPLFGREIDESAFGLALGEAVAHVNHLYLRGEAVRERREDGAWLWRLA
ncbi:MBL fold metallo-hydrolase [Rhodobacterales bacterium HKCCE2091]|nr:MBL fold metallo-hydrolase [Rhodobacterales bacterium HKCCE2091]